MTSDDFTPHAVVDAVCARLRARDAAASAADAQYASATAAFNRMWSSLYVGAATTSSDARVVVASEARRRETALHTKGQVRELTRLLDAVCDEMHAPASREQPESYAINTLHMLHFAAPHIYRNQRIGTRLLAWLNARTAAQAIAESRRLTEELSREDVDTDAARHTNADAASRRVTALLATHYADVPTAPIETSVMTSTTLARARDVSRLVGDDDDDDVDDAKMARALVITHVLERRAWTLAWTLTQAREDIDALRSAPPHIAQAPQYVSLVARDATLRASSAVTPRLVECLVYYLLIINRQRVTSAAATLCANAAGVQDAPPHYKA